MTTIQRICGIVLIGVAGQADAICTPGQSRVCYAHGQVGTQVCGSNGMFGECRVANPPPPPPPPPPPLPGDDDHDGLVDAYEDRLLNKFAPRVWLSYYENRWPVNVDWLLSRSRMRYSHIRCTDHQMLAWGAVTRHNITEQSHRNAYDPATSWPWNACDHHRPVNRSNGYTAEPRKSFFLQYLNSAHTGSTRPGDWTIYGHVYPIASEKIVIQYWQLYSYNDSFASANHEGDWEYTAVVIDHAETPKNIIFFRHGHAREAAISAVEWDGDHHITYSSKGGHAQYRGASVSGCLDADAQGFADTCSAGTAWNTWEPGFGGIVNVGEKYYPLNDANWLRYSGRWGEIGAASATSVDFTSGPQGPAYQPGNWFWGKSP
jgi:hypothetical protein